MFTRQPDALSPSTLVSDENRRWALLEISAGEPAYRGVHSTKTILRRLRSGKTFWTDLVYCPGKTLGWTRLCDLAEMRDSFPALPESQLLNTLLVSSHQEFKARSRLKIELVPASAPEPAAVPRKGHLRLQARRSVNASVFLGMGDRLQELGPCVDASSSGVQVKTDLWDKAWLGQEYELQIVPDSASAYRVRARIVWYDPRHGRIGFQFTKA